MVKKRVLVLLALSVLLLGCASQPQQAGEGATPTATTEKPAAKSITIGTGGVGGVYIYYGSGVASIISKYTDISANAVQTKASVDNLLYIAKSPEDTIGLVMGSTAMEAWNGKLEAFNKQPQKWLRVLWVMYPNVQHIVTTADSGIKTVYDLKGKRVSTGAPGSVQRGTPLQRSELQELTPKKILLPGRSLEQRSLLMLCLMERSMHTSGMVEYLQLQ